MTETKLSTAEVRQSYQSPTLISFGQVRELTTAGSGMNTEMVNGGDVKKKP